MAGSLTVYGKKRLCHTGLDRLLVEVHQTDLFHLSKHSARFGSPEDPAIWLCNLINKPSSSKTRQCFCLVVLRWQMNHFWFVDESESTKLKKGEKTKKRGSLKKRLIAKLECSLKTWTCEKQCCFYFVLFFWGGGVGGGGGWFQVMHFVNHSNISSLSLLWKHLEKCVIMFFHKTTAVYHQIQSVLQQLTEIIVCSVDFFF